MALIGVDIGTQGTKTALYSDGGALLAESVEPSELRRPAPGVVEEDPDRQVGSVCRTVARCIEASGITPGDISGLSIDGQMAGIIGVDHAAEAVTPYDSWLDTRCSPQIEILGSEAPAVTRLTGCAPSFNHGPKILWWKTEHPDVFSKIAAFVQPGGYAAMKLCGMSGGDAFIDHTYLHFSGFADNRAGRWSEELLRRFDVPDQKLPRIVAPTDIVGRVSRAMASKTGLLEGTPVAAGCGDTAASFLSCGATREGICVDVAGTASVFAATTGEFRADVDQFVLGCGQAVTAGLWHPYAYINGGGMNLEWFVELLTGAGGDPNQISLERLGELAAQVANPDELPLFIPHFAGRVMPPMPKLRGSWVGLDWSHGIGELYRAMLESVALEYRVYKDVLASLYATFEPTELRITGGGEKSPIWNQIKADVLEMPVAGIVGGGGAPLGSALLAGYAVGVFESLDKAAQTWISVGPFTEPEPAAAAVCRYRSRRYVELISLLNDFAGRPGKTGGENP